MPPTSSEPRLAVADAAGAAGAAGAALPFGVPWDAAAPETAASAAAVAAALSPVTASDAGLDAAALGGADGTPLAPAPACGCDAWPVPGATAPVDAAPVAADGLPDAAGLAIGALGAATS